MSVTALKYLVAALSQHSAPSWAVVRQQAQSLGQQVGQPTSEASGLVLGNLAVQYGMRELLIGSLDAKSLSALEKQISRESLTKLIQRTFDPSREFVTALIPKS